MDRRVLILSFAYPPSSAVGAFRAARFAKYLSEFGWTPLVVTAESEMSTVEPDESRGRWVDRCTVVERTRPWEMPLAWKRGWRSVRKRHLETAAERETARPSDAAGAAYVAVADTNGTPRSLRAACRDAAMNAAWAITSPFRIPDKRIWWAVPALAAMRRIVREYRPCALFSTSPPHSSHLIALALKAWTGIPTVIDLRDPWSHDDWKEAHQSGLTRAIQRRLERLCYARADRVILNTPELLADVRRRVPAEWHEKFSVIPNGYDPQLRETIEALVRAAPAKDSAAPLRLCHAGSVYGRRDIRPLIEAVAQLNRQGHNVVFEQVGTLANVAEVAACVAQSGAGRAAQLLGQQPHDEALRRMAAADILVVVRQNTGLQVPAKIYEMMLFGKPILALDDEGAVTRLIRQYQLGVVADPVDPAAIAAGILRAAEQIAAPPAEERGAALRQFDGRAQTRQLAGILEAAVQSRRGRKRRNLIHAASE